METEPLLADKENTRGNLYTKGILGTGLGLKWTDVSVAAINKNG